MARTARSLIREAHASATTIVDTNLPMIADDGFTPEMSAQSPDNNPLAELIDDRTYEILLSHGLLYEKAMRDYQIRKNYREMRKEMPSADAIERLRDAHPYLQYDTIRKIIYAKAS
jgi:hypothetical protein